MRLHDCHKRLKEVVRSYGTALKTINAYVAIVRHEPKRLVELDMKFADVAGLPLEIRDLYFVQLFATFESIVRNYWHANVRRSSPATLQLLASNATRRGIPKDVLDAVQAIRESRNLLIHENHNLQKRFPLE